MHMSIKISNYLTHKVIYAPQHINQTNLCKYQQVRYRASKFTSVCFFHVTATFLIWTKTVTTLPKKYMTTFTEATTTSSVLEAINQTQKKGYLFDMLSITKHAHLHLWAGNMRQLNWATETLVLLRVVVLQPDLKFDCLHEVPLLLSGIVHDSRDGLLQSFHL